MRQVILTCSMVSAVLGGIGCGSSGGGGLQPGINGCTTSYAIATAATANRTINFGGGLGNAYDQKCLQIAQGQMVTFSGDFSAHPLVPGIAPSQRGGPDAGSPNNPIQSINGGSTATFTFGTPGFYPYYCALHEAQGMFGTIEVLGA